MPAPARSAAVSAPAHGAREEERARGPVGRTGAPVAPEVAVRLAAPQSPASLLTLQRLAGNRAVTDLVHNEPVSVQRGLFSRKKKPSTSEVIDSGFTAATTQSGGDQMQGLLPYAAQVATLAGRAKMVELFDDSFKGSDPLMREGLKTAVLTSSLSNEKLQQKVSALALDAKKDPTPTQRQAAAKLSAELGKGSKKELAATMKALYARCVVAASTLRDERDDDAFKNEQGDSEEMQGLRSNVRTVSKISATSFDMALSERLLKARDETVAGYEKQGKKPLETTVLGAGPVGLIAAIEANLAGANVHVYEMRRSGPARGNVLKLDEVTFAKLRRIGVYGALFGPDHTKGDAKLSHGVSVAWLEEMLRARATQLGIKITYGYGLEEITGGGEDGKTKVRLKKYVPTRPGPEMDVLNTMKSQKGGDTTPEYIDCTSDLVIGATGAGGSTGSKLGLERERMKDEGGEDMVDFAGTGVFEPDHLDTHVPGQDKDRNGRWQIGLRTPAADYLLTQISREQFVQFKDDSGARDSFMGERGKNSAGFQGKLRSSGAFDITLNQAKQFVNEQVSGVVIGDEAATPHPWTGSGFNTGAATTSHIGGLVRDLTTGDKKTAFSTYGKGAKSRTDKMIQKGLDYFRGKTYAKNKPSPAPKPVPKDVPQEEQKVSGGGEGFYTPEDIGVTPETELEYQDAQDKTEALYGRGPRARRGYTPEDIGVTPETQSRYDEIQSRIDAMFGLPKRDYMHEDSKETESV